MTDQKDEQPKVTHIVDAKGKSAKKKKEKEGHRPDVEEVIGVLSFIVDVFVDDAGKASATMREPGADHITMPVGGRLFGAHVRRIAHEKLNTILRTRQVNEVSDWFEARAYERGEVIATLPRYCYSNGAIWIDRVKGYTKIDASGVKDLSSIDDPTVRFRRAQTALPIEPTCEEAATLAEFSDVFGVDEKIGAILLAWCMGAMLPHIACPILVFHSEQRSAKTTKAEHIRRIVDPDMIEHVGDQPDLRSTAISIFNSRLWIADNLSGISDGLSDLLCRAATGGTYAVRALHTDNEQNIMQLRRAIVLTGLDSTGSRADLQSRMLVVSLPRIDVLKTESEVRAKFLDALPRIRRLVYNGVQAYLTALSDGSLVHETSQHMRMADWLVAVSAAEQVWCLPAGWISELVADRSAELRAEALAAEPLIPLTLRMLSVTGAGRVGYEWSGSPGALHQALVRYDKQKELPKDRAALGKAMLRVAPLLRSVGVEFARRKSMFGAEYTLTILPGFEVLLQSPDENDW